LVAERHSEVCQRPLRDFTHYPPHVTDVAGGQFIKRIAFFVAAVLGSSMAAKAQPVSTATPSAICTFDPSGPNVDIAALRSAAAFANAALAGKSATLASANSLLEMPLGGADTPSDGDRARYCAAAGEILRVAPDGNQAQAKTFLLGAAHHATATGDARLAALVTYRLGLAALSGDAAAGAGTRGAQQTVATTPDSPETWSDNPCAALDRPGFARLAGRFAARAAFECATVRARAANDPAMAALASLRLARFGIAQAQSFPNLARRLRSDAANVALRGLNDTRGITDPARRGDLTARLAEAALDAGSTDTSAISAAIPSIRSNPGTAAFAAALEGRLALKRGDRAPASMAFQRAVFLEGQRAQPMMMPTWLLLLAEAEPARRAALTLQAYRALEAVRPLIAALDPVTEESSFAIRMRPVFEAAVAVELANAGGTQEQARIASAQRIVEAYRQAELQSAFGSNCVPSRDPVDPAKLRAGEVLLYPILLDDRVELLVVAGGSGGSSTYVRVPSGAPTSREAVGRLVDDMVSSASRGTDEEWRTAGRTLYNLLIKPVEGRLGANGTLIIVPDGALRALPFAALTDGDGKFLIERTRLAVAPALAYSQPGSDRGSRALSVVAASLQREVTLPSGVFAKLEGTADEAGVAAGPGGRVIADFREADLRRALSRGRVDVLHLATHAAFNGRSDRSFIVANGEAIPLADLRGLIGANRTRGDELDLLVLSACETAVGDDEASMGLAGAAVQSGAESALASLWSVNDTGTVALMKGFYGQYRQRAGKAEALRNAQLAMISGGGTNAQPGIWAAFILLGGWR
jgi:CHAT domain-containing protein